MRDREGGRVISLRACLAALAASLVLAVVSAACASDSEDSSPAQQAAGGAVVEVAGADGGDGVPESEAAGGAVVEVAGADGGDGVPESEAAGGAVVEVAGADGGDGVPESEAAGGAVVEVAGTDSAPDPVDIAMDRAALVALYQSTHGDNWHLNDNWLTDAPLDEWFGVLTDSASGRVIRLDLENNGLTGEIPAEFGQLTALEVLNLRATWNYISDLSALSSLHNLRELYVASNRISNLSSLAGLPRLEVLLVVDNAISDISPLLGIMSLRELYLEDNPLDIASVSRHIPDLESRGVTVWSDGYATTGGDFSLADGPRLYNDNLFVLPVAKGGSSNYASDFYQYFGDEFDFLMFLPADSSFFDAVAAGWYESASNDVLGINLEVYSNSTSFGSAGKLQGTITFRSVSELSNIASHELMHRWAAHVMPSEITDGVHWLTFGNMGGVMDGGYFITPFEEIIDLGDGQYSAEFLIGRRYSPLELYLAGFILPEDVPEFWVAADGEWVWDEASVEYTEPGQPERVTFAASEIKRYTIDDVIAAHGRRIPQAAESQREFRAAAILLIDEAFPAVDTKLLDIASSAVTWFSYPGVLDSSEYWSENFYESTGGRATLIMDGLSQFQKEPG